MTSRPLFIVAALLLVGCGQAVPPRPAEAARKVDTPPRPEPPPTIARAPSEVGPASAPTKPAAATPVPAQAPAAKPVSPPAKPAPPSPPSAKPAPPPPTAKPPAPQAAPPAQPTLDLKSLEARLKDTAAIGVLTKLSLKNQVDDLIARFLAFHDGNRPPTLSELRPAYELLLMKVLSLLQDKDAALARDINASREALWSLLTDRQQLARYK